MSDIPRSLIEVIQEKARQFVSSRALAYRRTFPLTSPDARIVLGDLARFAHAHETPFRKDQRATDVLIGRQEMFLRIQQHLQMTDKELWEFFTPRQPLKGD